MGSAACRRPARSVDSRRPTTSAFSHTGGTGGHRKRSFRGAPRLPRLARYAESVILMASSDHPDLLVSSMADKIRPEAQGFRTLPPEALSHWLPGLSVPACWIATPFALTSVKPARVLTRSAGDGSGEWIGCEVINLYQFSGSATADLIEQGADCTLRDLGVSAPITYRITMPPELGIVATRSRGATVLGVRLWGQVTNYLVKSGSVSGLIEHTLLIRTTVRGQLKAEISLLSDTVRSSLITSVRTQAARRQTVHPLQNPQTMGTSRERAEGPTH